MGLKLKEVNWRNLKLPKGVLSNWYIVSQAMIDKGWKLIKYEETTYKIIIDKDGVRMSIYLSTMTVQTVMQHPNRRSPTQLTRNKLTHKEFLAVIKNPREHTGKGHY